MGSMKELSADITDEKVTAYVKEAINRLEHILYEETRTALTLEQKEVLSEELILIAVEKIVEMHDTSPKKKE